MEREPEYYVDRLPTLSKTIEGKTETSFVEISPQDARHIPLPPVIAWTNTRLRFQRVGFYNMPLRFGGYDTITLYQGWLDHPTATDLSTLISTNKSILYTGTSNGFYAHDPIMIGKSSRDYPFYVVGIQPYELKENMGKIAAVWHENGHVYIFDEDLDIQLLQAAVTLRKGDLPPVALGLRYGEYLARSISEGERTKLRNLVLDRYLLSQFEAANYQVRNAMSLFHERNAWAAGAWIVRLKKLPTGFTHSSSYFDYAKLCLESYAHHRHDDKFVKGWR